MFALVLYELFGVSAGVAMFLGSFEGLFLVAGLGIAVQERIHAQRADQDV
jgi:hypothetical protein